MVKIMYKFNRLLRKCKVLRFSDLSLPNDQNAQQQRDLREKREYGFYLQWILVRFVKYA